MKAYYMNWTPILPTLATVTARCLHPIVQVQLHRDSAVSPTHRSFCSGKAWLRGCSYILPFLHAFRLAVAQLRSPAR